MERLSPEEMIFLYNSYMRSGESVKGARNKWRSQKNGEPVPPRATIELLVKRFNRTGNVNEDKESLKTSQTRVRTPEVRDVAKEVLEQDPTTLVRKLVQKLNISRERARLILRKDLDLHPYKIQMVQPLTIDNSRERYEFANRVCELIDSKQLDPNAIIITDEAHFWPGEYVNRQNYRIWGSENPHVAISKPLHPQRVTV